MAKVDFENSQTKKNLEIAFAGESQACVKYGYYSSKAKKEGYVQISNIFAETSKNESEHAKLWFKALHEGDVLFRTSAMQLQASTTRTL